MPSFRKLVSAICAAAMLASVSVVPVFADEEIAAEAPVEEAVIEAADEAEAPVEEAVEAPVDEIDAIVPAAEDNEIMPIAEGDIYNDFESYDTGTRVVMGNPNAPVPDTGITGVTLYVGARNGGDSGSNISIENGGVTGKCLALNSGNFVSANRGPRIELMTPADMEVVMATMQVKKNSGQKLMYGDDTSSQGTNEIAIPDTSWHTLSIYIMDGQRVFTLDGAFVTSDYRTSLPVIWGTDSNGSGGKLQIDNLEIREMVEQDYAAYYAGTIDIASSSIIAQDNGVYRIFSDVTLPESTGGQNITWTTESSAITIDGNKVTVNEAGSTVEITASVTYGESVSTKTFKLELMTPQMLADEGVEKLDIANGTTVVKSGDVYKVSGDFDVDGSYSLATITWAVKDEVDPGLVSVDGTRINAYPKSSVENKTTTITATVKYNDGVATKDFVLDLTDYNAEIAAFTDLGVANNVIKYADSPDELVHLDAADGAVIFSDLTLPAEELVENEGAEATLTVTWGVTSEDGSLADNGVISVSDKNAHPVTLTKTVSYIKNGITLDAKSASYSMNVQFDPDAVKAAITNAITATPEPIEPDPSASPEATTAPAATAAPVSEDAYLRPLLYTYQVRFDAALESNFSGVPTAFTANTSFTLPITGLFGSTFTWYSNNTQAIAIANSTASATVKRLSSDTNVTLTAYISAGTAEQKSHTRNAVVYGTGTGGSTGTSNSGGGSRPKGSVNNTGGIAGPTTPVTDNKSDYTGPNPSGFTDLDSVPWALTAINNLYVNGVINGKTATLFYPNDSVTRAEFAKILINAFNIPTVSVSSATFSDVPTGHWASSFVETAYQKGIITGYDNGAFDPDAKVTRQDMAVMVQRAAASMGYQLEAEVEAVTFTDAADIASYAASAVETLQKAGIVSGTGNGAYEPLATSTRAQACQMIYNVFN